MADENEIPSNSNTAEVLQRWLDRIAEREKAEREAAKGPHDVINDRIRSVRRGDFREVDKTEIPKENQVMNEVLRGRKGVTYRTGRKEKDQIPEENRAINNTIRRIAGRGGDE